MMNLEQCEIKQLKQENAELRAHVERLRENLKSIVDNEECSCRFDHNGNCQEHTCFRGDYNCYVIDDKRLLDETPAQSLQQIKSDAVLEATRNNIPSSVANAHAGDEYSQGFMDAMVACEEHANNLVKDGE